MATVKQYQINLDSESRTFHLGGGDNLTIKNGTIIDENHIIAKKFPSHCTYIGEKLEDTVVTLNEDPISATVVEEVPEVTTAPVDVEQVVEDTEKPAKRGPKPKTQE